VRRLTIAVDAGLVIRHQGAVADVELLPGSGNPPLVAGESAHGDTVAAIANAVCHVIVVRVRSLPRTRGCQEVLPVRRADLDMLRAAAHRRPCEKMHIHSELSVQSCHHGCAHARCNDLAQDPQQGSSEKRAARGTSAMSWHRSALSSSGKSRPPTSNPGTGQTTPQCPLVSCARNSV
jgi:hypothetical protein